MSDHSNSVKLGEIIQEFGLEILHPGANYASIPLTTLDVNRPGLPLTGFFEHFDPRRLVVIGLAETTFLEQMDADLRRERFDQMLEYSVPALILTRGLEPCPECMEMAEKHDRTVLRTQAHTSAFMSALIGSLYNYLAPQITRSGVMMEIYGEGVLFQGESGVGKSEVAIELIQRGHRIIADDAVEIKQTNHGTLVATAPELIRHYMELRGIGVVDVRQLFGMSAIKISQEIDMVINLGGVGPLHHHPGEAGPEPGQYRGGGRHQQPEPEDGPQRSPGADPPDGRALQKAVGRGGRGGCISDLT